MHLLRFAKPIAGCDNLTSYQGHRAPKQEKVSTQWKQGDKTRINLETTGRGHRSSSRPSIK